MEKQQYAKIFKWCAWVLMLVSVAILCWGALKGFPQTVAGDNGTVDPLLNWTYVMVGLTIAAVVLVGIYVTATTNPKGLVKLGIVVVAAAVVCFIAYLLAPGAPAVGYTGAELPTQSTLKLTDTVLNLTYLAGGAAILSIVVAEILSALRNKKA